MSAPQPRVLISRWRSHRDTPFGQPFRYTESRDLKTPMDPPWWRRLFSRRRQPLAWVLFDTDESGAIVQAFLVVDGEIKISPLQHQSFTPLYDLDTVMALAEMGVQFERSHLHV